MGGTVGIEIAPQSDWPTVEKKGAYPRKFRDYIHVWECQVDKLDEDLAVCNPINLNQVETLQETSCYIIIHVQYKKVIHNSLSKDFSSKAQTENARWKEFFSSFSSIKKTSLNQPLISKEKCQVAATSAYYEIYVWSGNGSTTTTRSVAIAEAYKLDQILKSNKSTTGTLRMVCSNEFTFLPFDMETLDSLLQRHKAKNHLINSILTTGRSQRFVLPK